MKLWGGRFAGATHPLLEEFGRSLESDSRLAIFDVRTCRAHVQMLSEVGAVAPGVAGPLLEALQKLHNELEDGSLQPSGAHEDVHSWVEAELKTRVGDSSSYLRLGRSRNDLGVTDFRLWCMAACTRLQAAIAIRT
jgi:argininosuccinate lyase